MQRWRETKENTSLQYGGEWAYALLYWTSRVARRCTGEKTATARAYDSLHDPANFLSGIINDNDNFNLKNYVDGFTIT